MKSEEVVDILNMNNENKTLIQLITIFFEIAAPVIYKAGGS